MFRSRMRAQVSVHSQSQSQSHFRQFVKPNFILKKGPTYFVSKGTLYLMFERDFTIQTFYCTKIAARNPLIITPTNSTSLFSVL